MTQDRIYFVRSDDGVGHHSWSFISCLVGECRYKKKRYILNEGRWYEIDETYLQTIEDFAKNIPSSNLKMPPYADADEGAYNKRAVSLNKDTFALLDKNFINYPPRGKIEVCDIYTKQRTFIHVKKCGASSTLSHLFSQGIVSAQLMVSEPGFRRQFQEKLPKSYYWGDPEDAIRAAEFEVCYAIVGRPKQSLNLPFFSKISLRSAVRNLQQLGFRVSLAEISA